MLVEFDNSSDSTLKEVSKWLFVVRNVANFELGIVCLFVNKQHVVEATGLTGIGDWSLRCVGPSKIFLFIDFKIQL